MSRRKTDPIRVARESLIQNLVKAITGMIWRTRGFLVDEDDLAGEIRLWLPLTYAEAQAEFDQMDEDTKPPKKQKQSEISRLRAALGHDRGNHDLTETIAKAADICERLKLRKKK